MSIYQKKSLSQVFLKDRWPVEDMVKKIVTLAPRRVLEVGPGGGILTEELLKAGFHVTAVEKDRRFAEKLPKVLSLYSDQLVVECADILEYDLKAWIDSSDEPAFVVGNIPYHISTPIMSWVFPHLPQLLGAMFLTQLEFAKRVAAVHGNKEYGSLSVFAQLRSQTEFLFKVPRGCFRPSPKVDSGVLLMTKRATPIAEDLLAKTEIICRSAFSQRRKMLSNSLSKVLAEIPAEKWPFDPKLRAEQLSPLDFLKIAELI